MDIKKGYKNTEVGVIPEDWEVKEFGEICYTSKSRINPITSVSNYRCVELEHLSQGSGLLLGYANFKDLKSQKSYFEKGDVLFGKLRPYLRKFYFADFEGVCTTEIWVLKTEKKTSNRFLFHLVQSDKIVEAANLSTGTKMPRAEWKTVSETKIAVPTKAEQTAIATALSDADALINSLVKLISKKRNIKLGAMQKLLEPREGWEVRKLGEILKNIQLGGNYPNSDVVTNYPLIKMGNIQRGYISINKVEYIISDYIPENKDKLNHGDVLFNTRNTLDLVGKVSIWQNQLAKAYFNSNLMRLEFNPEIISSNFFMNLLFNTRSVISKLKDIATGTTSVAAIYTRDLLKIEMPIPPKEEQVRIATILSDMDAEISALESKLEKYKKVKLGIMQNLLTGKIRLI